MVNLFLGSTMWAFLSGNPRQKVSLLYGSSSDHPRSPRDVALDLQKDLLIKLPITAYLLWGKQQAAHAQTRIDPLTAAIAKEAASGAVPLDLVKAKNVIEKGQVYVHHNFVSADLAQALRNEIGEYVIANKFQPSGLSNFAKAGRVDFTGLC